MFVDGHRSGRDDLLFYVMYDHNEDRDTVEFMRRDSKTLPRYTLRYIYTQCIRSGAPWVLSWLCARQFMHISACTLRVLAYFRLEAETAVQGPLACLVPPRYFTFVFGVVHVQCTCMYRIVML